EPDRRGPADAARDASDAVPDPRARNRDASGPPRRRVVERRPRGHDRRRASHDRGVGGVADHGPVPRGRPDGRHDRRGRPHPDGLSERDGVGSGRRPSALRAGDGARDVVMATVRDLYDVLGVARDASPDDIRRAYRKLARELHPDVSADPATEERFKEVTGAYEILSDPQKRQRYHAFGAAGGPQGQPFTDIQDIFDLFFGGGLNVGGRSRGPRSRAQRGEDAGIRLSLSFREAVFGARREIDVERLAVCDRCLGNGAEPGTAPITCRTCGGTGEIRACGGASSAPWLPPRF